MLHITVLFLLCAGFRCAVTAISRSYGAHGVVVSHPLSMQEALGSIPSVSIFAQASACLDVKVWMSERMGKSELRCLSTALAAAGAKEGHEFFLCRAFTVYGPCLRVFFLAAAFSF